MVCAPCAGRGLRSVSAATSLPSPLRQLCSLRSCWRGKTVQIMRAVLYSLNASSGEWPDMPRRATAT